MEGKGVSKGSNADSSQRDNTLSLSPYHELLCKVYTEDLFAAIIRFCDLVEAGPPVVVVAITCSHIHML
jgi:hypothetical protein